MTTWKKVELEVARRLGGNRLPITGRIRGSAPDGETAWLCIEVKHRKTLPKWLHNAMEQAVLSVLSKEDRQHKIPIVVLHEKYKAHDENFVIMRQQDFENLLSLPGQDWKELKDERDPKRDQ
jgi:hypothetical protein